MKISSEDVERFEIKINKTASCWEWTACTNEHGYGRFSVSGKPEKHTVFHMKSIWVKYQKDFVPYIVATTQYV